MISIEIKKLSHSIINESIIRDWHTRMFKWYGRGKAQSFSDIQVFLDAGSIFKSKPPDILYRGINIPYIKEELTNDQLLKLCNGVRSWSQNTRGPKYYARTCLTPKCINIIFVWLNPDTSQVLL